MQIMQVYSKDCASSCPYITTIVDGISICTHAGVPCLSVPDDECAQLDFLDYIKTYNMLLDDIR